MRKRVLFIWFKKPTGILEGGGLANQRNYQMASAVLGADNVDSYYIHAEHQTHPLWNKLRSALLTPFNYWNGLTPGKVKEILRIAPRYDFIFINTTVYGLLAKKLKAAGYKGTVIAHFHNVESIYYEANLPRRMPLRRLLLKCVWHNDAYACQYADKVVCLNERDSRKLQEIYGRKADFITPIAIADKAPRTQDAPAAQTSAKPVCLFLGSDIAANVEGILWFVHNVLPAVSIDLRIVGKGMGKVQSQHPELQKLEVVDSPADLTPYFLQADFMLLPIFSGSGMKVKTCESLMYGKNIIGTDEAFEGYAIDAEQVGARCNTAQEFIDALRHYAAHPRPHHNAYSRQLYLSKYSPAATESLYRRIFDA